MQYKKESQPVFKPFCLAATIGSLPHTDVARGTALVFKNTPEIASWVQFPKRNLHENMMMQFTEGIPALVHDGNRTYISTSADDFVFQNFGSTSDFLSSENMKFSYMLPLSLLSLEKLSMQIFLKPKSIK